MNKSLFHEQWWLRAVTGGHYKEITVEQGGNLVGRLPYVTMRRGPFLISRMPPFTHVLGPWVHSGVGKPQTRLTKRLSIVRELVDQLPPLALIEQCFDPSMDDSLALVDGLAFQDRRFTVAPQYTFEIDCRKPVEVLWSSMHFKTRQHVRRAEEKYTVRNIDDPDQFGRIYADNMRALGRVNRVDFSSFPKLYEECRTRQCGQILAAFTADGQPVSTVYLVWSSTTMYYLLSSRAANPGDNGSTNLLIWSAMKLAHERGVMFDLDGVYTSGTARFLSGFGGDVKTRLLVRRSNLIFSALQSAKLRLANNQTQYFT